MDLGTVEEVVVARRREDLTRIGADTKVLAGGTFLYSELQHRLRRLVDITQLGWEPVLVHADGLELAATCTLDTLNNTDYPESWSATSLFEPSCAALLASWKIWRFATVGGNVCLSLPAGAITGLLTALDATATVWAPDGSDREISLCCFVTGPGSNVLRPGEVVRRFHIDTATLESRATLRKAALAPLGRSGALVFGRVGADGRFVLTVTAATIRPVQLRFERMPSSAQLRDAVSDIDLELWFDDPHGAPDWRRHVTGVLGQEILQELAS